MKNNIENETYQGVFSIGHKSDDIEEVSTEALRQSYTEGNLDAGNRLALRLQKGRLCEANPEEALNIFRTLAKQGHLMGIYNYAEALESGRGTAQNLDEAKKWYDIAIDRGLPVAMTNQAFLLTWGPENLQDHKRAYELAREAAALGEEESMYLLGLFHITNKYGCKDEFKAFECFKKAVDMGASAFAYRWIGICYEKGLGVEQDEELAEEWMRRAIERGLPQNLVKEKYRHLLDSATTCPQKKV